MDEQPENNIQMREAGDESKGSPWTALTVLLVALMALCSAIYFVDIRQDELKAANALVEAEASKAALPLMSPATAEKK